MQPPARHRLNLILLLFFTSLLAFGQSTPFNEEDIEVGIVEKLGDTIPLHLEFLNESNDTVTLDEVIDKPTILNFVYFDCPGICGPLLSGVSEVVEKLDMEIGKEYQVVTISFNTKDSPEKARKKKSNFVQNISQANWPHWKYLTGEQEEIDAITDAVGYKYKPTGLDFAHPAGIIILSPEGKITRYLYGLTFLPFNVKMSLIEARKGQTSPTINKVLEYCFAYDPEGRTYTLQLTRVVGGFILFVALIVLAILIIKGRRKR